MRRKTFVSEPLEPRVLLSSYDAAKDFSLTQNPSGAWTYGVRFTETADFAAFAIPAATQLDFGAGAQGWSENSGSPPYVGINTTGAEYDSEGITLPTGVLVMHPGGNGEYADLRFTAPAAATLSVAYRAIGIDTNGTTTDEHVLYNGKEIGSGSVNGYEDLVTGSYKVSVVQGDTLDFLVGPGKNNTFYNDATSMSVQISPTGASGNHLVFSQQPKDGNERTPEPTQVKIEDSKNNVVTTATDGVTLSLQEGSGQEYLGYVPFVRGVATFTGANAPIVSAGTDTFIAEETSDSHQFSGSADPVTSTSFHISELHLAFTRQPAVTGADQPFVVGVELEDDKNRPIKIPELNPRLSFFSFNEATGENGSATIVPFVNGKLVTLSIATLGTYEIDVSQIDETGQAVDAFTNARTAPITVLGNHLEFIKQPGNIGTGDAATFIVGLLNYKNKPIPPTGLTGSFSALLNNTIETIDVVPFTLVNGKYDNSKSSNGSPLVVPSSGSFTITVAEVIPGTDVDAGEGITPISSLAFQVIPPHLVFTRQPTTIGAGDPIPFAVELETLQKKPSAAAGDLIVIVNISNDFLSQTNRPLVNATYDNTKPRAGIAPVTYSTPGTYEVTLFDLDPSTGSQADGVSQVSSAQFTIVPDHLVFSRQPSTVGINTPIPFQVALEDPKNKIIPFTNDNTNFLAFHINAISGNGSFSNGIDATGLTNGVYDNLTTDPAAQFEINGPGTYSFTVDIEDEENNVLTQFTGVTSPAFKISG